MTDGNRPPILDSQGAPLAVGDEVAYDRSELADAGSRTRRKPGPATGYVAGFTDTGTVWVGIDTFPHDASALTRTGKRRL